MLSWMLGFHKMRDGSWLVKKLLAYQEKLLIEFNSVHCTVERFNAMCLSLTYLKPVRKLCIFNNCPTRCDYSVCYISVDSSTCFGCWHQSSGTRTAVITASRTEFQLNNESWRYQTRLTSARSCNYSCTSSWWWVSTPETCRAAYRNVLNWIQSHLFDSY